VDPAILRAIPEIDEAFDVPEIRHRTTGSVREGIVARVVVGTRAQVWFLRDAPDLASQVEPSHRHDACYLTRSSRFTGEIQGHELAWSGDDLWVVNTAFRSTKHITT
jgi:hypothetical protein